MSAPLLMTKLHIPLLGKYLVWRSNLVEKLHQSLEPGCRLALISAPAGFGKTTLISTWITASGDTFPERKIAWLSLDEGDNDPVIFWTYVISAVQTQQAGLGQQSKDLLVEQGSDLEGKLASFINDLYQVPHPCAIVLDDYHLIRNPLIHQSLTFFIEHLPPRIHLMIASRTDPPLPLALLRGRGQLLEIRLNELRFSIEDTDTYLNTGIGLNLAIQSVQKLNQKAEGWIAGLQMAALAMQDLSTRESPSFQQQQKLADFVASFSGSNRFILDYLIEEVLNRQPAAVQDFLVQTSIVDQLCGPLCDALLGEGARGATANAQAMLEYLESSNLFIFPMDDQRYWYRYHQLFADLLRKRLAQKDPELAQELHRRAIDWYEQNGLISRAIHHAFIIKDFQKAAKFVTQITEVMWGRGEHATLLTWMDALPAEEKKHYPGLLVFQVSILISAGRIQEAEACILLLESYIDASVKDDHNPSALIGNMSALRTYIASFYGDRPALFAHAQTALQNLTRDEDSAQRCTVSLVLGHAYFTEGALNSAEQAFDESIIYGKKAHKTPIVLSGLSNLALALWFQGNLSRAAQVCQEGMLLTQQYSLERSPMAVDILLTWGAILCERGQLAEADATIRRGLELAQEGQYVWHVSRGYQGVARLSMAQGNLAEAESAAQAADQWASAHEVPAHLSCPGRGLLAEVWLRQGKTSQAERYLADGQVGLNETIKFPRQSEYLGLARLKWLQGDESVVQLLERISLWAETNQQKAAWIATLILQALVAQSRRDREQGMRFLEQAFDLAEPDGYVQSFVEEGEPLAVMLREAARLNIHAAYANLLLSVFSDTSPEAATGSPQASKPGLPKHLPSESMPLAEPLSRRELETLQFIAEGLSNKEIAQRMYISLRTVKYYSTGLYNKLGVDGRMQAVIRARELGLL